MNSASYSFLLCAITLSAMNSFGLIARPGLPCLPLATNLSGAMYLPGYCALPRLQCPPLATSVTDPDPNPDPSDPYVFGNPGSGSGPLQVRSNGRFSHFLKI
jgi:hypothetical protein